jgi:hypothetical protein
MSSYQHMDHARWVESNNRAMNRIYASHKSYTPAPETLTEFQARVTDILGMVFGGIYNAPISWKTAAWNYGGHDSVSVVAWAGGGFSTYDFNKMTMLVFLCHEARIRAELDPAGPKRLRLSFWQRAADGEMHAQHPNLDEAVAAFRAYLPGDHRIIYRAPSAEEAA